MDCRAGFAQGLFHAEIGKMKCIRGECNEFLIAPIPCLMVFPEQDYAMGT